MLAMTSTPTRPRESHRAGSAGLGPGRYVDGYRGQKKNPRDGREQPDRSQREAVRHPRLTGDDDCDGRERRPSRFGFGGNVATTATPRRWPRLPVGRRDAACRPLRGIAAEPIGQGKPPFRGALPNLSRHLTGRRRLPPPSRKSPSAPTEQQQQHYDDYYPASCAHLISPPRRQNSDHGPPRPDASPIRLFTRCYADLHSRSSSRGRSPRLTSRRISRRRTTPRSPPSGGSLLLR